MAEARKLKAGKWRLYRSPELEPVRDPQTRKIVTFDSFQSAARWWRQANPTAPAALEANKCARCGAYFGPASDWTLCAGRYYHRAHSPQADVIPGVRTLER